MNIKFLLMLYLTSFFLNSFNNDLVAQNKLSSNLYTGHQSIINKDKNGNITSYTDIQSYSTHNSFQLFKSADGTLYKQTQWQYLNPLPQGNPLFGVCLLNQDTIFACGVAGTIISSTNKGVNWNVNFRVGDQESFRSIRFVNATKGFALTLNEGFLLKTTDAGKSWIVVDPQNLVHAYSIIFVGENNGFISSLGGIYSSNDGGDTWNFHYHGFQGGAISFYDSLRGFVAGTNGNILRTLDGGYTWQLLNTGTTNNICDFSFQDSLNTYALARGLNASELFKTSDGGNTWIKLPPTNLGTAQKFAFPTKTSIIIVGGSLLHGDDIIKSTDSGNTFSVVYVNKHSLLRDVFFSDSLFGAAVGDDAQILFTSDGGDSWNHLDNDKYENLNSIFFTTRDTGFAVGEQGAILNSFNGGANWEKEIIGNESRYMDLSFINKTIGFAVGRKQDNFGIILKTTNSGETWEENQIYNGELKSIFFKDENNGFIVGQPTINGASIIYTSDGGDNWAPINVELDPKCYNEISFLNNNFGSIASGYFYDNFGSFPKGSVTGPGAILITTNGGNIWSKRGSDNFPTDFSIRSTLFLDTLIGYAVGSASVIPLLGFPQWPIILKTTDGGYNWSIKFQTSDFGCFKKIYFFDNDNGIVVGGNAVGGGLDVYSYIYQTTDGGDNWFQQNVPIRQDIKDIDVIENLSQNKTLNGYTLYTVGGAGTILVSTISPLSPKIWTWTGAQDSSWNNSNNWNPSGVPLPGDSVIIPYSLQHPVIYKTQQQIVIGSLDLQSGGMLTITDSLKRFVVLGDVKINGTLEIRDNAQTSIVVGGNWIIQPGGYKEKEASVTSSDEGFLAGNSTVYFTGNGMFESNFYNVVLDTNSIMSSSGNILVDGRLTMISNLAMSNTDTLFIENDHPQSIIGTGKIIGGTIKRSLLNSSVENYQFESENTFLKFDGTGTYPEFVSITTYPDTSPTSFGTDWIEVPSTIDPVNNVVTADSVTDFSRWSIRIPRRAGNYEMVPDSFVHRVYDINAQGGSDYKAKLSLRYDQSEVPAGVIEDSLRLFKLNESTNINDEEVIIPTVMTLYQNFPNPFNSSTKIRYDIPERGQVSLVLYDVLGREVNRLVNLELEPGHYEAEFNGNDLSSGVYFYKLSVNSNSVNRSITKKLILLK